MPLLEEFWQPFTKLVEHTDSSVTREQASQARVLGDDGRGVGDRMREQHVGARRGQRLGGLGAEARRDDGVEQPVRDRDVSQIDLAAYYDSARLLAHFLAYLDDTLRLREERKVAAPPPDAG